MRFSSSVAYFLLSALASASRDYAHRDYYALHLEPSISPQDIASHLGVTLEGRLGELQDHYLFSYPRTHQDLIQDVVTEHKHRKRRRDIGYKNNLLDGILLTQKQKLRPPMVKRVVPPSPLGVSKPVSQNQPSTGGEELDPAVVKGLDIAKQLGITDPIFGEQWHLYNPVQIGHDINVTGVWLQGITGKNSTVVIVDDGLDMDSQDLKPNYYAEGSYDFNDHVDEPKPRLADDRHGTRCAGEVSAARNDVCGVGVAYDSKIAGIRILSKAITDADEAIAMNYGFEKTQIFSCSWGPPDDGREMGAPGILIKRAMINAVQNGRAGLGTIYVFAAGNGAASDDNCNFDGYTNSIYSITVGAIDRQGNHPYYSEKCSAQLIVTYSSGAGDAIHTTDVGENACFNGHGGTSAAGPLAVGIYALVLEIRPDLTWRDMQWLTVLTAVPLEQDSDWQNTTIGKRFSHQFGYGKLDAWQVVEAAKNFTSVKPQAWYNSPWQHIRQKIPEGDLGLASTFSVTRDLLGKANFETIEHVTVTMNIDHTRRGDLSVDLRSPSGIISHLSTARRNDGSRAGYEDWTFMSVAHWGESGLGNWTVVVKDTVPNEFNGTLVDWKLSFYGECRNATIQGLLPFPNEHDDDDHDRQDGIASTTSILIPTSTSALPTINPSDHPDRPVNSKPTEPPTASSITSSTGIVAATTVTPEQPVTTTTETFPSSTSTMIVPPTASASSSADSFLPSPFPSFGVSKSTQTWVYGAGALILVFCVSISTYFYMARRKRLRFGQESYEFNALNDEDEAGAGGRNRHKRRAGDLYDAFAGGSDENLFSDDGSDYQDDGDETHRPR